MLLSLIFSEISSLIFSLKNNEKVFINVVCCSRDWRFQDTKQAEVSRLQRANCSPVAAKTHLLNLAVYVRLVVFHRDT